MSTELSRNIKRLREDIGHFNELSTPAKLVAAERVICQISVILDQIGDELERQASRLRLVVIEKEVD